VLACVLPAAVLTIGMGRLSKVRIKPNQNEKPNQNKTATKSKQNQMK